MGRQSLVSRVFPLASVRCNLSLNRGLTPFVSRCYSVLRDRRAFLFFVAEAGGNGFVEEEAGL